MKLKIKFLNWSAGLPVALLNEKTAEEIGVAAKDRVSIKTLSAKPREISTIIDTIENHLVKKNEIIVSSELQKILNLKKGEKVNVILCSGSQSLDLIKKKLNNKALSKEEISAIIKDIMTNSLSEAEIALFISAMYRNGTTMDETISLIDAILKSGKKLKLKAKYMVDKHSIGGIAGNRTTPIIVAICASAGLTIPKTSSRAITTAAGTADVIETIAKVEFSIKELKKIVRQTGGCMIWGGALGLVPADSKIIKIEKSLGIDPEAQLIASIMAKKLATGAKYILIDIPYGKTAKVSKEKALNLKKKFEYLGRHFHKKLKVVLTKGDQPMGYGVGPALELLDVIAVLNPKEQGPRDLRKKSLFLASQILEMTGKFKKGEGLKIATEILDSGKAFEKFKEIIKAQHGALKHITLGKFRKTIFFSKSGKICEIDNKKINTLAREAGCPFNKYAGLYIYHKLGEKIKKGEKLMTIYAQSKAHLQEAFEFYNSQKPIKIK